MKRTAIYPGTFDPVTLGHVDIVTRGLKLFDRIVVGVADNPNKGPLFDAETRVSMVRETFVSEPKIEVARFSGLLVGLAHQYHAAAILRGFASGFGF